MTQERTVWLPWNSFYAMDTLVMKTEENSIPSCDLSGFVRPDPVIISSPLSTFFSDAPGRNPIVPETQVRTEGKIQKLVVRCYCWHKHLPQPPVVSWSCYSKKLCRVVFILTDNKFSDEDCSRYPMFLSPRLVCLWLPCTFSLSHSIFLYFNWKLTCFKGILQRLCCMLLSTVPISCMLFRTKENFTCFHFSTQLIFTLYELLVEIAGSFSCIFFYSPCT